MINEPQVIQQGELISLVRGIATCYKDAKINTEIQKTEREKIRQQARVLIATHEMDVNRAIEEIRKESSRCVEIIREVGAIMTRSDVDKDIINFCMYMMDKLDEK